MKLSCTLIACQLLILWSSRPTHVLAGNKVMRRSPDKAEASKLKLRHAQHQDLDTFSSISSSKGPIQQLANIFMHPLPRSSGQDQRQLKADKVKICHWTEGQPKAEGGGKWVLTEISRAAWESAHFSQHVDDSGEYKDCRCHEDEAAGCNCNEFGCTGICFNVDCSALTDQCNIGICDSGTGACKKEPVDDGLSCNDGDLCSQEDTCQSGTCVGTKLDCSALTDQCNIGICDSGTGACKKEPVDDGLSCNDGDRCSREDTCQSGLCLGVDLVASIGACIGGSLATESYVDTEVGGLGDTVQSWIAQNVATETYVDETVESICGGHSTAVDIIGGLDTLSRDSPTSYGSVTEAITDVTSSLQKQILELQALLNALRPDCGNGSLDPGEECDDGNEVGGDGCSVICTLECPEDADCEVNGLKGVCDPDGHCITSRSCQLGSGICGERKNDILGKSDSGSALALSADGRRVAIGAPYNDENGDNSGHVRVFQLVNLDNCNSIWKQVGSDIDGEGDGDKSGHSVDISASGDRVVIGGYYKYEEGEDISTSSGHVRVYDLVEGNWTKTADFPDVVPTAYKAIAVDAWYSVTMSADGSTVVIGAYKNDFENGIAIGIVQVYKNTEGDWAKLGQDILGEERGDEWGYSVAISADGSIIAVGAPYNNADSPRSTSSGDLGHVRVFRLDADSSGSPTWNQLGGNIVGERVKDFSGCSIALSSDGKIVVIGARGNDGGDKYWMTHSGHVRVYKLDENANPPFWKQLGSDIDGEAPEDRSGWSVAISGDGTKLVIGAIGNDDKHKFTTGRDRYRHRGHVQVYEWDKIRRDWAKTFDDIDGEFAYDQFGESVAISTDGTTIAAAAPYNDCYPPLSKRGQVYVYGLHGGGSCSCET